MAWDLAGPVRQGGLSDQIVCAPVPEGLEACLVEEPPPVVSLPTIFPVNLPLNHQPVVDLSPLVGELARLTLVLHQIRDEHRLQTEMLQEALLPWYKRLLRWIQQQRDRF